FPDALFLDESSLPPPRGRDRRPMLRYAARRLAQLVPTLLGVVLLTFVLFNVIGGSPAAQVLGKNATAEQIAEYDHAHGWDRPLPVQFARYVADVCRGDFGESLQYRQPVAEVLGRGAAVSIGLTAPILVVGTVAALCIGLLCAARAGRRLDRAMLGATTALMSVNYVIWVSAGQYLLAYKWGLFPIWGFEDWTYLLLPAIVGVVSGLGSDVRFYRTVVLDEIRKPYVRTAVAKGLSPARVLFGHVLRNCLVQVVTNASLAVPFLFTGSILLESFYGLPGLGGVGLDAVYAADFATVRAVVLISALLYQLSNLAADLICAWLDPRIRLAG
ncbi:MAG: ABC transporter permease, partial [Kiritimatiellae bacterium]|nr:ABC transporter permease [Kiritimatiellia bacterium]